MCCLSNMYIMKKKVVFELWKKCPPSQRVLSTPVWHLLGPGSFFLSNPQMAKILDPPWIFSVSSEKCLVCLAIGRRDPGASFDIIRRFSRLTNKLCWHRKNQCHPFWGPFWPIEYRWSGPGPDHLCSIGQNGPKNGWHWFFWCQQSLFVSRKNLLVMSNDVPGSLLPIAKQRKHFSDETWKI